MSTSGGLERTNGGAAQAPRTNEGASESRANTNERTRTWYVWGAGHSGLWLAPALNLSHIREGNVGTAHGITWREATPCIAVVPNQYSPARYWHGSFSNPNKIYSNLDMKGRAEIETNHHDMSKNEINLYEVKNNKEINMKDKRPRIKRQNKERTSP